MISNCTISNIELVRKEKTIKNIYAKLISNAMNVAIGFISRKIFLQFIGIEYLGLNGLLTSLLSMLSLIELGIGSAIYYSLIKPLSEKNNEEIKSIMRLYSRLYIFIGLAFFGIGLLLLPLLPYIVKTDISPTNVNLIYILFLTDSALTYFLSYRRNIFSADQKEFVVTNIDSIFQLITFFVQLAVILVTQNYLIYLIVRIITNITRNIIIYSKSNHVYSFLRERNVEPLKAHTKNIITKNIKALFIINLSTYIVFGTDNLLLSIFVNLGSVAIYSNYTLIFSMINSVFNTFIISTKASVGNFLVSESDESIYKMFKNIYFFNFIITSYTSVALFIISNSFIDLWLGTKYTWSIYIVAILIFNNYSRQILTTFGVFKDAAGLYSPYPMFKYLALVEGVINLVVSIFLVKYMGFGISGIFIGTATSTIVSTIVLQQVVYKFIFKLNYINAIKDYLKYLFLTLTYTVICYKLFILFRTGNGFIDVMYGLVISLIIPNAFSIAIFRKSEEFKYFANFTKSFLKKKGIVR